LYTSLKFGFRYVSTNFINLVKVMRHMTLHRRLIRKSKANYWQYKKSIRIPIVFTSFYTVLITFSGIRIYSNAYIPKTFQMLSSIIGRKSSIPLNSEIQIYHQPYIKSVLVCAGPVCWVRTSLGRMGGKNRSCTKHRPSRHHCRPALRFKPDIT